jgi:PDZ domain
MDAAAKQQEGSSSSATPAAVGGRYRQRQQSGLLSPRAIVVLHSSDMLNQSNHRGVGGLEPVLADGYLNDDEGSDAGGGDNMSAAVAYPVGVLVNPSSAPMSLSPHLVETCESMPIGHLRPEFIYVKVCKATPSSPLGITLRRGADYVRVTRVKNDGLLGRDGRPLVRPGDRILAVNGVSCVRFSTVKVAKLIRNARSTVSLVVWNRDGDPNLVSCTVQKPSLDRKVGVCIKNDHGAVRVSRVHPDGLFAGSLLLPGHRCVKINGIRIDGLKSKDAAAMISLCNDFVTIESRPKQECAMVLSCEVHSDWWKSLYSSLSVRTFSVVTAHSLHV